MLVKDSLVEDEAIDKSEFSLNLVVGRDKDERQVDKDRIDD